MSIYYPQGAITLNVRWEDFGNDQDKQLNDVYKFSVLARNLMVEINDYTEADKFSCEIDYKEFPFDPRTIRSCMVVISIEDKKAVFKNDNSLNLIDQADENKVFTGFVDEESISLDDETRTVTMEGRDFTSLLIDERYLQKPISLSKPVDKIIEDLLLSLEATKRIEVENRTGDDNLPTLAKLAPNFNEKTSVRNTKRKDTYWDVIQNIISRAGLIGYMELDKFVINKPRSLYSEKDAKSKLFVYGKNLKDLTYKRKLGRFKGFNIRVLSLDIEGKRVIEAKVPEEAVTVGIKGPAVTIPQLDSEGKKIKDPKKAPYLTFRVPDISSKEHLIKIGEKIFEELGRQQIEGSFTTYEMEIPEISSIVTKSTNSKNEKYVQTRPVSFRDIRNGTPIEVYINQQDMQEMRSDSNMSQKRSFLVSRGYPSEVASVLASSMNRISTPFYTKNVRLEINQDSGFKMDIEFINFIDTTNSKLVI